MSKVKSSSNGGGFFPKGGSTKMATQQGVHPSRAGQVSTSSAGKGAKFAEGGKGKMCGKGSAAPAKAR
jgi:hypothetical protein